MYLEFFLQVFGISDKNLSFLCMVYEKNKQIQKSEHFYLVYQRPAKKNCAKSKKF